MAKRANAVNKTSCCFADAGFKQLFFSLQCNAMYCAFAALERAVMSRESKMKRIRELS